MFCAIGGHAAPSIASEGEAVAAVPYIAHAGTTLTAENLGLNDLQDPVLPGPAEAAPAPVATHAMAPALPEQGTEQADRRDGRSLSQLVEDYASSDTPDRESDCLARAVYYESKGEPLAGQLTVAEVIINRSRSGRFASTICGVVRQPGQFSFVRRGSIPTPPAGSRDWRIAVAISRIAMQDLADGGAPRALFFHARRVSPGWRLTRIATVGNHVFYR
ncbi:MAG TPA: cell wall hydrolase [Allosphingosinicella sp.]|jgi:spore germination cell wall hydrolase CwlJ-like protein|nr:cell wall hydrolase [Allosphingosinicella sp.]